jgi:hypothetical protein
MDSLEFIVARLNEILETEQFEKEQFDFYLKTLEEKYFCVIKIIDFEFYNEEKLHEAQIEKKKGVELQNFEYAANCRDLEKMCLKCLETKAEWKIDKSAFIIQTVVNSRIVPALNQLFYCHFASALNDSLVKKLIKNKVSR